MFPQPPDPDPPQPPWQGEKAPEQAWPEGTTPPPLAPDSSAPTRPRQRQRLLLGLLAVLMAGVAVVAVALRDDEEPLRVADLSTGDCLVSADLAAERPAVGSLESVPCSEAHDAEVFASYDVPADAGDFGLPAAGTACVTELTNLGSSLDQLGAQGLEVRPLIGDAELGPGDRVVCFLRHQDGDKLSARVIQESVR